MKKTSPLDHTAKEGHGDDAGAPQVSKGTFTDGGGTYMPLPIHPTAHSSNAKTGKPGGVDYPQ